MKTEKNEFPRRLINPGYLTEHLSWDWNPLSFMRAKTVRIVALSGKEDLNFHGMKIEKPLGVVELLGSRIGKLTTVMLAIFSSEEQDKKSTFFLTESLALGVMYFPPSMFSGVVQLTSAPAVYFRMGEDGSINSITNDGNFTNNPSC